jgi:uncharacterized membrane protein
MDFVTKNILATLILIALAIIMYFYTPKKPSAFGYKTPRSIKNPDTWNYANHLAKRLFLAVVGVFLIAEILFYRFGSSDEWAYKRSAQVLIISTLLVIPIVEIALYLRFDRNGNQRNRKNP